MDAYVVGALAEVEYESSQRGIDGVEHDLVDLLDDIYFSFQSATLDDNVDLGAILLFSHLWYSGFYHEYDAR